MNLLSDAAQAQTWPEIAPLITKGKTLYFSHGFSVVYKDDTKVIPPKDVDVILCAPKGSGITVRTMFKEGRGINASIAVWQDISGKAQEKAVALGVGIGAGYMYQTTFEKEVYSDLFGERGVVSQNFNLRAIISLLMTWSQLAAGIRTCTFCHVFVSLMFLKRVCSRRSMMSYAQMDTRHRRRSMKLSRRRHRAFSPSSDSMGQSSGSRAEARR